MREGDVEWKEVVCVCMYVCMLSRRGGWMYYVFVKSRPSLPHTAPVLLPCHQPCLVSCLWTQYRHLRSRFNVKIFRCRMLCRCCPSRRRKVVVSFALRTADVANDVKHTRGKTKHEPCPSCVSFCTPAPALVGPDEHNWLS